MSYEITGDDVLEVNEIVTKKQTAVIRTFFDKYYHTELAYDGTNVNATIKNYLGSLVVTYTDPIIFEYEDQTFSAAPVNGVASITFSSTVAGQHVVRTANPGMRNGEVTINV